MKNELKSFQRVAVAWLKTKKKGILGLDQGLGKTVIAAVALKQIAPRKTLIVVPASVQINWQRELKKWANIDAEIYPNSGYVTIVSWASVHKIYKNYLGHHLILDECQYMKNRNAKRTKVAMKLVHATDSMWALSGTPIPNRPIEIWPLGFSMGAFPFTYRDFGYKFCAGWKTPWNTEDFSGSSNLDVLSKLLEKVMLRITKETAELQLPKKSYQILSLDLPIDKREKQYNLADLEAKSTPLNIVGLAEIMQDQGLKKVDLAVAHIKDVLEHEQKIIVLAYHKSVVAALEEKLSKFGLVKFVGSTSMKDRQLAVDSFQKDSKVRIFLGNTEACKTGLTLTAASRAIFVESSWSPKDIDQMVDRMHRIGQEKPVLAQFLTTHKSIDEHQLRRALEKLKVIDEIIKETDPKSWESIALKNEGDFMKDKTEQMTAIILKGVAKALERIADELAKDEQVAEVKKKGRGRPKKVKTEEPEQEQEPEREPEQEPEPEPVEANFDDCRNALKSVLLKKDRATCHNILAECEAESLSQLLPDRYSLFVALCKGVLDE